MFKTVTSSNYDEIFRNIKDAAARELKLLKREAEKLDWSLMLDTDLREFGLMSADGLIGQYPYMQPGSYQADTASISRVRNLVSLFVEKFQSVSNQLEQSQRRADELRGETERLNAKLEQITTRLCAAGYENTKLDDQLRAARAERRELQDQLRAAQAELAKLKEASDGDATATETGKTA